MIRLARLTRWGAPQLFSSPQSALEHLADHVLTSPEAMAWAELLDPYPVDPHDADARWRYARDLFRGTANPQPLYDAFVAVLERAAADAQACGLVAELDGTRVALGLDGVLLYIDTRHNVLRTAYLPNQGSAERTAQAHARAQTPTPTNRTSDPLPREAPEQLGGRDLKPRDARAMQARRKRRDRDQRIYYHLFRPARTSVRATRLDRSAYTTRGEAALLLEPLRALGLNNDFQRWRDHRAQVRA